MKEYLKIAIVSAVVMFALSWADSKWGILPGGKPMSMGGTAP